MSKNGEQFPAKSKRTPVKIPEENDLPSTFPVLLGDIQDLIETARTRVAIGVNVTLLLRNWGIGSRIRKDILGKERAPYGKKIVATLSQQLAREYGREFVEASRHFKNWSGPQGFLTFVGNPPKRRYFLRER